MPQPACEQDPKSGQPVIDSKTAFQIERQPIIRQGKQVVPIAFLRQLPDQEFDLGHQGVRELFKFVALERETGQGPL